MRGRVFNFTDSLQIDLPVDLNSYSTSMALWLRRPHRERKVRGSNPACDGRSSHISDLKIGTPVVTLPGAWCYRVSAEAGRPDVSIL